MKLHEAKFIYIYIYIYIYYMYIYQGTGSLCPDGDACNDITRAQLSSLDHLSISRYTTPSPPKRNSSG